MIKLDKKSKINVLIKIDKSLTNILYAIEEEIVSGNSAVPTIEESLLMIESANEYFEGKIADCVVCLNGVKEKYKVLPYRPTIRKQILDMKGSIGKILAEVKGDK